MNTGEFPVPVLVTVRFNPGDKLKPSDDFSAASRDQKPTSLLVVDVNLATDPPEYLVSYANGTTAVMSATWVDSHYGRAPADE